MQFSLYAALNIFCILICIIILSRRIMSLDKQKDYKLFNYVIIASIIFFMFDAIWGFVDDGLLPKTKLITYILNAAYFICIGIASFRFYVYSEKQQNPCWISKKIQNYAAVGILVIYCILVLISYFCNSIFYVDDTGEYHRGVLYPLQLVLCYGYLLVTSIKAAVLANKKENYVNKRMLITLATFPLFPMALGTLQVAIYGLPMVSMGIALAILQAHTHFQEHLISIDPLTEINNRNEMIKYLSSKLNEKNKNLTLFILDVDDFKSINDKYGHLEGNQALIRVARALKLFAKDYNAFISRYAGDEFIVVCESCKLDETEFTIEVNKYLRNQLIFDNVEYDLHITVGMAKHCKELNSIPELIGQADIQLYENKRRRL